MIGSGSRLSDAGDVTESLYQLRLEVLAPVAMYGGRKSVVNDEGIE